MEKNLIREPVREYTKDNHRHITLANGNSVNEYKCDYCGGWGRAQWVRDDHPNPDANGFFCSRSCSWEAKRVAEGRPKEIRNPNAKRTDY